MADTRTPRGRPPLKRGDPSVSIHLRLPASQFDALDREAQAERLPGIPELIRRRLSVSDDDDDGDE